MASTSPPSPRLQLIPPISPERREPVDGFQSRGRQFSKPARAAASESPSPPRKQPLDGESPPLEMVWDGPRPRLRAVLKMQPNFAEPDFDCASSRALSTARRLGLDLLPELPPVSSGGANTARSTASGRGGGGKGRRRAGGEASPRQGHVVRTRAPPGGEAEPDWLAPEQLDFLQVLSGKMRETQSYISRRGPVEAQRATANLAASWNDAVQKPREELGLQRLCAIAPTPTLESVMQSKQRDARGARPPPWGGGADGAGFSPRRARVAGWDGGPGMAGAT